MYLVQQLWWFMLLAFLLGTLLGYVLWRACGRRHVQSGYERAQKDAASRIASLEKERDRFSKSALEAEREVARLKSQLDKARGAPGG
ncbi:MAG TPA: hypothetical protein PKD49_13145 [Hyphomicrobium sp.]|nr:hypothetical protein [Hyphomicrobium sp.]